MLLLLLVFALRLACVAVAPVSLLLFALRLTGTSFATVRKRVAADASLSLFLPGRCTTSMGDQAAPQAQSITDYLFPKTQDMPDGLAIGTERAWRRGDAFPYTWTMLHPGTETEQGLYVCNKSVTQLEDHKMILLVFDGWYYAFDVTTDQASPSSIQVHKALFRTKTRFWINGTHSWEEARAEPPANASGVQDLLRVPFRGSMGCITRQRDGVLVVPS